jgi:hypothetical protein
MSSATATARHGAVRWLKSSGFQVSVKKPDPRKDIDPPRGELICAEDCAAAFPTLPKPEPVLACTAGTLALLRARSASRVAAMFHLLQDVHSSA